MNFVRDFENRGKAGSYIVRLKKVLRSRLKFNDIDLKIDIRIKGESEIRKTVNERVPNKEALAKILRKA